MIIKPAVLNRIARKVGPSADESIVDIKRAKSVVTDYGAQTGVASVVYSDVPARFQYIGDYLHTGRAIQGLVRIDADVIISTAANTDLRSHDIIVKKSLARQNSRYYGTAQSVTINGFYYLCVSPGNTAAEAPVMSTVTGETITDGTVLWRCEGPSQEFVVTELLAPRTYGDYISKNAYAKFRQDG